VSPCGNSGRPADASNTFITSLRPPMAPIGKPPPMILPMAITKIPLLQAVS
jgi:hypothetical protein